MKNLQEAILTARSKAEHGDWVGAQNALLDFAGVKFQVTTEQEAKIGVISLYYSLLNEGDYTNAALLAWGDVQFNPNARAVQLIWRYLNDPTESKVLIMGAGSQGKTYTTSAWAVQNWSRDPQYTCGKIVSTTAGHAKSGIMSRISAFHNNSLIQIPGEVTAGGIIYPGSDKAASILQVAIPDGDSGEGRITGFHPYPRLSIHPQFGKMSRGFVVIDEADVVAEGLWRGVDNVLGNQDYQGSIKVIALTNPRNKANPFAYRAEPVDGWTSIGDDVDSWVSREGWRVIRLDASKSENVINKKTIFPGLMTYEGYMNYVRKGDKDPSYWTYARSIYPPESTATFNVVSLSSFQNSVGRLTFESYVTPVASIDPAFAFGGDEAIMTLGRFGTAIGFTSGNSMIFEHYPRARKALQVETQIVLSKGKSHEMGKQIIDLLRSYGVRPEWVAIDKTGPGRGLYDYLSWQYGSIMGIEWGSAATETKILQEDTEVANLRYKGISAEMWFAFAQWLDYGFIKFSPTMDRFFKLRDELTLRRWKYYQTLQQLEDKATFKADNKGRSCDMSDSLVMLVHPIRMRSQGLPATLSPAPVQLRQSVWAKDRSEIDAAIKWVDINK